MLVRQEHIIASADAGEAQPAGCVGAEGSASHRVIERGRHYEHRLADPGRAESASGFPRAPLRQVLECDLGQGNRLPGWQDVLAQQRLVVVAGLGLEVGWPARGKADASGN